MIVLPTPTARKRDLGHVRIAYEFGPDDITAAGHDVVETLRELCFVQTVEPHLRLQRAQLTGLDDYGATRSDCRGKFDAKEQRVRVPGRNQTGNADGLVGDRRLVPTPSQRQLLECLLGRRERVSTRLHDGRGELNDTSVLLDHRGRQIVDARRDYLVQPAQDIRALFLSRLAETDERALGSGDSAPRVLLIGQRYAGDHFAVARVDDVHDLAAVGFNEGSIDVVLRDCFHCASPPSWVVV